MGGLITGLLHGFTQTASEAIRAKEREQNEQRDTARRGAEALLKYGMETGDTHLAAVAMQAMNSNGKKGWNWKPDPNIKATLDQLVGNTYKMPGQEDIDKNYGQISSAWTGGSDELAGAGSSSGSGPGGQAGPQPVALPSASGSGPSGVGTPPPAALGGGVGSGTPPKPASSGPVAIASPPAMGSAALPQSSPVQGGGMLSLPPGPQPMPGGASGAGPAGPMALPAPGVGAPPPPVPGAQGGPSSAAPPAPPTGPASRVNEPTGAPGQPIGAGMINSSAGQQPGSGQPAGMAPAQPPPEPLLTVVPGLQLTPSQIKKISARMEPPPKPGTMGYHTAAARYRVEAYQALRDAQNDEVRAAQEAYQRHQDELRRQDQLRREAAAAEERRIDNARAEAALRQSAAATENAAALHRESLEYRKTEDERRHNEEQAKQQQARLATAQSRLTAILAKLDEEFPDHATDLAQETARRAKVMQYMNSAYVEAGITVQRNKKGEVRYIMGGQVLPSDPLATQ